MFVDIFNTSNKYKIIYADPPWEYKQSGSKTSSRGMAKQHYETMNIEEIKRLPVKNIKTDNAILFLWATMPNLEYALEVIKAWGFIYKTAAFVWVKKYKNGSNFWGMGAYTRANAELCLIAISKNTKAKQVVKSHKVHQIIEGAIEQHSKKPAPVREKIVELLGDVSKIELFARENVNGWDCWGNEVDTRLREVLDDEG